MNTIKHVVDNIIIDSKGILYKTTLPTDDYNIEFIKRSLSLYFIEKRKIYWQAPTTCRIKNGGIYFSFKNLLAPFQIKKKVKEKDYVKYLRYII
jgi:hypothetical protein